MRIFKKIFIMVLCLSIVLGLTACKNGTNENGSSDANEEKSKITVACLKGPTGVGMVKLMDDAANGRAMNNYEFTVATSADEISGKIVSGEINIASVPTNLAAKLYAKTNGNIVMLATNTLGALSFIENGDTVKSIADLKGKTVYSIGEGSNPEYILKYILKANGLEPDKDVKIQFVATNDELSAAIVSKKAEVAMISEPVATTVLTKKNTLKRVLEVNKEWKKVSNGELAMGCVVALKSYINSQKTAVENFIKEYETSLNYAKENVKEAASLCEKFGVIPSAAIAEKAIPECNINFATGENMKNSIKGYFEVLLNADSASVGGKLPETDFYYGA